MGNLIEEIQSEISRCTELVKLYEEIPTGGFGATMIRQSIEAAEKALASDDTVKMVRCLSDLRMRE